MTKKDYIAIARIIATIADVDLRIDIALLMARHFQDDNPRFDITKWLAAAGASGGRKPKELTNA